MTDVVDLGERRKKKKDEEYIFACDCGCAMFRLYSDGAVMCLNCEAEIEGLTVVISGDIDGDQ